jgi:hypothetical protein
MSIGNRTVTVLASAVLANALAGAAAFAAVPDRSDTATMSGMSAHMEGFDEGAMPEMHDLMTEGASVGEMQRWMIDAGFDLGQMHGQMADSGMNPGPMHRSMATPARR